MTHVVEVRQARRGWTPLAAVLLVAAWLATVGNLPLWRAVWALPEHNGWRGLVFSLALATWIGAALVSATWFASADLPAGVRFDAQRRVLEMPGSWQPMALMMAIFFTRYLVGVVLAMAPALIHDLATAAIVSSIYGALSGVFLGRMARMLRATRAGTPQAPQQASVAWG